MALADCLNSHYCHWLRKLDRSKAGAAFDHTRRFLSACHPSIISSRWFSRQSWRSRWSYYVSQGEPYVQRVVSVMICSHPVSLDRIASLVKITWQFHNLDRAQQRTNSLRFVRDFEGFGSRVTIPSERPEAEDNSRNFINQVWLVSLVASCGTMRFAKKVFPVARSLFTNTKSWRKRDFVNVHCRASWITTEVDGCSANMIGLRPVYKR